MSDHDDGLTIPPPRADRPPLRANIFESMQKGNTQLMPLFPHLYPGAMVPAGAILQGGPDKSFGHFFHHNTVDEVVVAFGANGSMLKTGQVFVGGRVHGVNSFMKDEKDPDSFAVMCITQRQSETGEQKEAFAIQCGNCRHEIFRRDFDATPKPDADQVTHPFPTVAVLPPFCDEFNGDEAARTCSECGHVNDPFPIEAWGWEDYTNQSATVREGLGALGEAQKQLDAS